MPVSPGESLISATKLIPVTPGTTKLPPHRGVWIGGAGNVAVTLTDGTTVTIAGVQAGTLLPLEVQQINAGSTATLMLLWV